MKKQLLVKAFTVGVLGLNFSLMSNLSAEEKQPLPEKLPLAQTELATKAPKVNPLDALPDVLAQFDGVNITKNEILDFISEQAKQQGIDISQLPPELLVNNIFGSVQNKISMMVFSAEAEKAGFKASKDAVVALLNKEINELKERSPQQFEMLKTAIMDKEKVTIEQYIEKISTDSKVQEGAAVSQWFDSKIKISDEDVANFFEQNKDRFKTPGDPKDAVRISHIMIALPEDPKDETATQNAYQKAEKILEQIKKDDKIFAKLAETESDCPSGKATNGSLGPQTKGQSVYGKEFEEAAFSLEIGKINDKPIKSLRGYHIIRRDEPAVESQKTLDEVKDIIKRGLTSQKTAELGKAEMDKVEADGRLKIFIKPPQNQFNVPMQ